MRINFKNLLLVLAILALYPIAFLVVYRLGLGVYGTRLAVMLLGLIIGFSAGIHALGIIER